MSKSCITAFAGYSQNILETATKLIHIFKYFRSITKQLLFKENIKKKRTIYSQIETAIKARSITF